MIIFIRNSYPSMELGLKLNHSVQPIKNIFQIFVSVFQMFKRIKNRFNS